MSSSLSWTSPEIRSIALGKQIAPIVYDSNCLEEACGSCAMLINGQAAMACSSLIDKLDQPIRLEPLSRFPIVRDLSVDRSILLENLKRVRAGNRRFVAEA